MNEKDLSQLALADVQRQFQTILGDIQAWIDFYDEEIKDLSLQPTQELASLKALRRLLHDFEQFSKHYYEFFQGVRIYAKSPKSKVNVLNTALGKILKEWATIQRAVEQRRTAYGDYLKATDLVAAACCGAFRGAKEGTAIVTYFEKIHDIARCLYSPIPLIGVPLSGYDAPEDWLSIAHEVGHYIYWNYADLRSYGEVQKNLERAVTKELVTRHADELAQGPDTFAQYAEIIRVCLNWLEEIFADTYGTLVAGPAFALSIQSLLLGRTSPASLLRHDNEHPIPYLRPFIRTQVLREIADEEEKKENKQFATDLRNHAVALEKQWEAHWRESGFTEEQEHLQSGQVSIEISRLKEELSDITKSLLRAEVIPYNGQERCLLDLVDYYKGPAHDKTSEAQKVLLDRGAINLDVIKAPPLMFVNASQMALSEVISDKAAARKMRRLTREKLVSQAAQQPSAIEELKRADAFSKVWAYLTGTQELPEQKKQWEWLLELDLSTASARFYKKCRNPECGALNPPTNETCSNCGNDL